jgi:hypothetical protein
MVVLILAGLAVGGAAQQEQVAEAGDGFKHLASQREQRVRFCPARSAESPPSAGPPS